LAMEYFLRMQVRIICNIVIIFVEKCITEKLHHPEPKGIIVKNQAISVPYSDDEELPVPNGHSPGVSFAEWRYETSSGHRAFSEGDFETAKVAYHRAKLISQSLLNIAHNGQIDLQCALNAFIETHRNLAEVFIRMGPIGDAELLLELLFLKICAQSKRVDIPSAARHIYAAQIERSRDIVLSFLEKTGACADRLLSIHELSQKQLNQAEFIA
ncbi:MAG: hypothetical protein AAGG02_21820, partial [Cyanobacteria bacterium P01_H01_bin.15]